MKLVNTKIDEKILHEFRDVIYRRKGLKKGDFQESIEEAMLDYILKYSKSEPVKEHVKSIKEKNAR